jgi:hypothetical protein
VRIDFDARAFRCDTRDRLSAKPTYETAAITHAEELSDDRARTAIFRLSS